MARIEPLGKHEVDDEIRHLCEESERQSGSSVTTITSPQECENRLKPAARALDKPRSSAARMNTTTG